MESKNRSRDKVLFWLVLVDVVLLIIQYIVGMFVNLYVQFPDTLPGSNGWEWGLSHSSFLVVHVLVGSIIVLFSIVALGFAIAMRRTSVITLSSLGFLMVAFAWINGREFLDNVQQNLYSYLMAVGFIGAVAFYGWLLRYLHNAARK